MLSRHSLGRLRTTVSVLSCGVSAGLLQGSISSRYLFLQQVVKCMIALPLIVLGVLSIYPTEVVSACQGVSVRVQSALVELVLQVLRVGLLLFAGITPLSLLLHPAH